MIAVILAAGVGSRLRPITDDCPKCLVKVCGKPILAHQIEAFLGAGIERILVVGGYRIDQVRAYCSDHYDDRVSIIENGEYDVTNNMFSLLLAKERVLGNPMLLCNGDVVFDPTIVATLCSDERRDLIPIHLGKWNDESMKVITDTEGIISGISKTITPDVSAGTSLDLYKLSGQSTQCLFDEIGRIVHAEGERGSWTEVALDNLMQRRAIEALPFDIEGKCWVEIDDFRDLTVADRAFSDVSADLEGRGLVFVDMDGTLFLGDAPVPGAPEFIERLRARSLPFYLLSNNSSRSKNDYVRKLARFGIDIDEREVLLSTDALIGYLVCKRINRVFVVGTQSMVDVLSEHGINNVADCVDYVVLGYDTELTYEKLRRAALLLADGARLVVTHPDLACPTPEGSIPDAGSMLALLKAATGVTPEQVFGKPNPEMLLPLIKEQRVLPKDALIIGDRLYTDIAMAKAIGCASVLVLSGETTRSHVQSAEQQPDLVVSSVAELA